MRKKQVEVLTFWNRFDNTKYHEFPELGIKTEPEPIEIVEVLPFTFYPDPEATDITSKWWHKLLFWRKYRYPREVINVKKVKLEDFSNDTKNN